MDKNNLIGFGLMFLVLIGYFYYTQPSEAELAAAQRAQDSIRVAQAAIETRDTVVSQQAPVIEESLPDSVQQLIANRDYGVFGPAFSGEEKLYTLENDTIKITFSSKGARIVEADLKKYSKIEEDSEGNETKLPLKLLEDKKNRFEYLFDVPNAAKKRISSQDLFYTVTQNGNTISFVAQLANGKSFTQTYTLEKDYQLAYSVSTKGLDQDLNQANGQVQLNWENYLDRLERNVDFERMYSSIYFKASDENVDYCSCRGDDNEVIESPTKWVSGVNQFFNSTLAATSKPFSSASVATVSVDENSSDLKKVTALLTIPQADMASGFDMKMYIGPNDFNALASFEDGLEYVIPYGWSIFGTINRYLIRPLFGFLMGLIGVEGIAIILLTLIVKLVVFPLTYKSLYAQSKMQALKPRIEKMKAKFPDDQQKAQMESMKLYREYGVNPAGGCLPMVLQMPIWYALFRFFPSTIDFRQASFLWATDLSSYDVFARLPFEVPFYGSHISLFTVLWAISTVIYTYFNTKHMDMSAQPAMKYVQYAMPLMFLFFFNNYSAGLTCYMFFSNLFNIGQNTITKSVLIDQKKIEQELQKSKAKPKKQSGFQARLEKMLQEQQKVAEQQKNSKGKKK